MQREAAPRGKIRVHSLEGDYFMSVDKWPALVETSKISPEEQETKGGSYKDRIMTASEEESGEQTWQSPAPKRKRKKSCHPTVATRAISRIPRTGEPIIEKASKRMRERDELMEGNIKNNPFTILSNTSNSHIEKVIGDLDIDVRDIDT